MIQTENRKICCDCGKEKELSLFVKDNRRPDGHRNRCKECQNLRRRKTPIKPTPKEGYKYCACCGKELQIQEFNVRKGKPHSYCKQCEHEKNNNKYFHICEDCGKQYFSGNKNSHICKDCNSKKLGKLGAKILGSIDWSGENNPMFGVHRFGKDNPNYKEWLTEEDRINRRLIDGYTTFISECLKRDNYTCQRCGDSRGGNLQVHHKDGYNWCKEKRTDINNGITFCKDCHKEFHTIYGYGNNTQKQLEEFLYVNTEVSQEIKES